jgi:hypothetical protein
MVKDGTLLSVVQGLGIGLHDLRSKNMRESCAFWASLKFIIFVITFSLGSGWVVNFVVGIL